MAVLKRTVTAFLSAVLVIVGVYTYSFSAFAATQYGMINGTKVNIRKATNTSSASLGTLSNVKVVVNQMVTGTEAEKGKGTTWYNITTLDGKTTGFVYGAYLTLIEEKQEEITVNTDFDTQLAKFPESYKSALKALHSAYPNWSFVADNIDMTLDAFINLEANTVNRKQVIKSWCNAYKSMQNGAYDWDNDAFKETNGGWCSASRQIIAYYVDPRNFLNTTDAFLFLDQSYDSKTQTKDKLKATYGSTFLGKGYDVDGNGTIEPTEIDAYFDDLMEAAEKSGVNPYVLASKIIGEQGSGGDKTLINGTYEENGGIYYGYYNFFNIGASGSTSTAVIVNGLKRAKANGWDTRNASIVGGAVAYANGYINNGQCTNYYMDYDCVSEKHSTSPHQYAQNVADAVSKATWIRKAYENNKTISLTFKIPVFKSMPTAVYTKPAASTNYNNFYLLSFEAAGITPAFNKYSNSYSFGVSENTSVYAALHGKAKLGKTSYALNSGTNVINVTVTSETGINNTYTFTVNAAKACTLTLTTEKIVEPPQEEPQDEPTEEPQTVKKGDLNGDNTIDGIDLARIKQFLLDLREFTDSEKTAADINGDNVIDGIDLARIKLHLLGTRIIE